MTNLSVGSVYPVRPIRVSLIILSVVFLSEILFMLSLPVLFGNTHFSWIETTLDAAMLTVVLLPVLWFTVIRPLQELAQMRARLLDEFIILQEEERRRIAFDLHDEIGQSLTSVMMGLRALGDQPNAMSDRERLNDLREIVNQAVNEVRRIANGLRPAALDHLGLLSALQRMAEDTRQIHDLEVECSLEVGDVSTLSVPLQTAIYRIVQEALTNVLRHADADKVRVLVARGKSEVLIEIEDNGRGLDNLDNKDENRGMGLQGMEKRASLFGGDFKTTSAAGRGTLIRVRLPIRQ
ncbi:hypothetical protein GC197_08230 [bacterium]|nr:hypothetical protein [bacterium]